MKIDKSSIYIFKLQTITSFMLWMDEIASFQGLRPLHVNHTTNDNVLKNSKRCGVERAKNHL